MAKKSTKKAVRSLGLATTSAEGAARLAKTASPAIPVEPVQEQPNDGQPGLSDTKMAQSIPVKPVDPSANSGAGLPEPSMSEGSQTEALPQAAVAPAANVVGLPVENAQGISQSADAPAPGATKPSDNRSSVPSSATKMSVGSPKESIPNPGASPTFKKNSPSVLKAHQAAQDSEFQVSPRLAAMHARMRGEKKASAEWQDHVDHVQRQAEAWDAGYTAAQAGKPIAIAKLAYQKVDIGCMKEFVDGFQARVAELKTALNWEDAMKEIGQEGECALADVNGQTMVVHAHEEDHSDGVHFMYYVTDESGEQVQAAGGFASLDAAKSMAEQWVAEHAKSASKTAQGAGNDSPGTRSPDVAGMRPVSGEAIEGTGGPEVKMAEVEEEEASMSEVAKMASGGDLTNIGKGQGIALAPEDYGRVLASLGHSKEAVDQATKDYYENYYGQYGKQLTKDEALQGPASKSAKTAQSLESIPPEVEEVYHELSEMRVKLRGAFDQMQTGVDKDAVEKVLNMLRDAQDALVKAFSKYGKQAKKATNEGQVPPMGHDTFGDSTGQDKGMQPAARALAFEVKEAALHGERNELIVGYDKSLNDVCSELQVKHHIKSFVQRLGGEMSKNWGVVADIQVQELDTKKAQATVTFRALQGNSPFVPKVKAE
jgi:hypothetical protein